MVLAEYEVICHGSEELHQRICICVIWTLAFEAGWASSKARSSRSGMNCLVAKAFAVFPAHELLLLVTFRWLIHGDERQPS